MQETDGPATRGASTASIARQLIPVGVMLGLAVAPLLVSGYPRGHDWSLELVRVAQWGAALLDGQGVPAWAPDLYHGFGSPIFVFYGPLFSGLAWTFGLLAGGPIAGSVVVLVLAMIAGATGLVAATRAARHATSGSALSSGDRIAAYCFLVGPYLLTDLYIRNANAELLALAAVPWAIAAVVGPRVRLALLAGSIAIVLLAHSLTTLVAISLVGLFCLTGDRPGRRVLSAMAAGLTAAGLTAWYWWPLLAHRDLLRSDDLLRGKFAVAENFVPLLHTFGLQPPYAVGPLPVITVLAGGWLWFRSPRTGRVAGTAVTASIAIVLLMHPASSAVWAAVPGLPFFQFPWRLLGPLALLTGLLAATVVDALPVGKFRLAAEMAAVVALLAAAAPILASARPLDDPAAIAGGLSPTAVRSAPHRATVLDEYVPLGADTTVWRAGPRSVVAADPGVRVEVRSEVGSSIGLSVEGPTSATITLGRWWFPGWTCRLDDDPCRATPSPNGLVTVNVPTGRHELELRYGSPPGRRAGLLLTGLVLLGALAVSRSRKRRSA